MRTVHALLWFGTGQFYTALQWRHNERGGVSHHRHLYCLLNRLYRRRVTGLWWGMHRCPVDSPDKGPVTWKMVPFHDFIMLCFRITSVVSGKIYNCPSAIEATLKKSSLKISTCGWPVSNMASVWLTAVLPANEEPFLEMDFNLERS